MPLFNFVHYVRDLPESIGTRSTKTARSLENEIDQFSAKLCETRESYVPYLCRFISEILFQRVLLLPLPPFAIFFLQNTATNDVVPTLSTCAGSRHRSFVLQSTTTTLDLVRPKGRTKTFSTFCDSREHASLKALHSPRRPRSHLLSSQEKRKCL